MESRIAKRRKTALAVGGDEYIKRRNEFVRAAAEVFKEKGYAAANIGDVAAYLDVDRASLYYYVESKEELFHEVVREAAEQNALRAEEIRDGEGSAEEKIRALIKSTVESYGEQPYLFVYIQEDMKRVAVGDSPWAKKMRSVNRRYDHAVLAIVQEGVDDGTLRLVGPPNVVAYGLIGMVNWMHRWFTPKSGMSAETVGDIFADMILHGLAV
jgi:TetR/AcrR family transcriptional regulator, cholesterol catabolism regulator